MRTSGGQLERLNKRSGTPSIWKPSKTMSTLTKVSLSKTRKQHYFSLISNQQNHPTMLFFTNNHLVHSIDPHSSITTFGFSFYQQLLVPGKTKASTCSLEPSATDLFKACLSALCHTMVNIITSSLGSLEQFSSGFSQTICHHGFSFHTDDTYIYLPSWLPSKTLDRDPLPVFPPTQNSGNTSLWPSSLFTGHL